MNVTVTVWVTVTLSVVSVAVYVIDSAVVSSASNVSSPFPFVAGITTPPASSEGNTRPVVDGFDVPETSPATVTVFPASGFPNWSSIVTVREAAETPSAATVVGDAANADLEGDASGT